ncbi:MAG: nitrilase-related carbon-nitrogen hydrolase [Vigna little leaf phytoplasma]|nr:nitrilase-related carbon-nitrogen hydrolase [Vigna little leaf phytoplasma]
MYKNDSVKIELVSPNLYIGNPIKNAYSILEVLNQSKANFVLFPELCLSSYTVGDLFFETSFYQENLKALYFILTKNKFNGVFIIGMPFILEELIFNVAIIIQKKKILGIVPKKTIPNYKEFSEKRWFQSGKNLKTQIINLLGQKVPIGDILFVNKQFDIKFGVEICQDLWTIESPSDLLTLNGAHLIFNLSSSTEHTTKPLFRKIAVIDHSRKQIGGYFYTSSGITESVTDTLFSNHKIAAVLGQIIGEKDLFSTDISLVVDVFVDAIKYQRKIDTTYGDQCVGKKFDFFQSFFEINKTNFYILEKPLNPQPFIEFDNFYGLQDELKLANMIQILALKSKINRIEPNARIFLEMTDKLNALLTLLVLVQIGRSQLLYLSRIVIILNEHNFDDKKFLFYMKEWLTQINISYLVNKDLRMNKAVLDIDSPLSDLILESYNLSDIALGKITNRYIVDFKYLYNVNIGISNTFMIELLKFHLSSPTISLSHNLKQFYLKQITQFLTKNLIIEDFILYHHLTNNFTKEKIASLITQTFNLTFENSLVLVTKYINNFYQVQYKRQYLSPGPKIFSYSLSQRTELRLPTHLY